ncbi:hypothetical protein FG386_002063 [Cryptosporidium ryanae]|uniref:uncharacterized protein n=1 Tax=Cryptosporidium ryanae TaxID=515981 RepID=UPI00351A49D1|nr:hypothetical protein FG386_002063 [Cryptosporidium ryanae]
MIAAKVSDVYSILRDIESKGGKEEYKVKLENTGDSLDDSYGKMCEYLKIAGFTVVDSNNGENKNIVMVLERESYSESSIKEAIKAIQERDQSRTTTPTSSRGKKDNYIDKSLKMEEELARVRAEKAEKYKNSGGNSEGSSKKNANNGIPTTGGINPSSGTGQSSLRRFMNFDWFTSMFSSRRGGSGNQRNNRLYLDSSYYRSKNTGCCGPSCGS